jgi:hypothetical protein
VARNLGVISPFRASSKPGSFSRMDIATSFEMI